MAKQLTWRVAFSHSIPRYSDFSALEKWLALVLGNYAEQEREDLHPGDDKIPAKVGRWLRHCLQLSRFILQVVRVPVFDLPEIINCRLEDQISQKWHTTVALARIDNFPAEVYSAGLKTSFSLAEWVLTREPTAANLEYFFETIRKQVFVPHSRVLPRGKSTLEVLRVAYGKGIPFRHLSGGVYQLGWGARACQIDRSTTEFDSSIGSKLSQSKVLTAKLLRSAGLPSAKHQAVTTIEDALTVTQHLGWPVVVKPADRDGGVGVTIDVTDQAKLRTAFDLASKLSRSKQVIIEQQVDGVCHRLFVSNGKLLYAVKRLPMSVVGNGKEAVSELVASELKRQQRIPSWTRSKLIPLDSLALAAIYAAGFSESSVPDKGVLVPLRRIESSEWGGVDEEVTNCIHPENLRIAFAASKLFRLNVAGIDIICQDISKPWYENGAIINEVNFAPLLGGGDISNRHIPRFLDQYIYGNGRIPVEVFVGGKSAWQAATERWQCLLREGAKAYITSGFQTLDPSGKIFHMPFTGLFQAARALVLRSDVEAIVLAVQTDELLDTGRPLEFVDLITLVDKQLVPYGSQGGRLPPERTELLIQLLAKWQVMV